MSDNDSIDGLIALGFLALVGFGFYKVIKSFGSFERGEEVTEDDLVDEGYYSESIENKDEENEPCENCGDFNPELFEECGHCKNCHKACERCECCLTCNRHNIGYSIGDLCERCDREAHDDD